MKILAFDSTAKVACAAVLSDDKTLALYSIDNGLTQSELLLPMAEAMLSSLKMSFSDIDAFAVTCGPGSFTGVRIGAALVKGLAFGKGLPCISVSTLEALAENLRGTDGIIVPCMDARRSQLYTAIFSSKGGELTRITEDSAISISDLYTILSEYKNDPIYLCGDGYDVAHKGLCDLGLTLMNTPRLLRDQNASSVALVAKRMLHRNEYSTDEQLKPTYLRLPQAERERLEKEKKG